MCVQHVYNTVCVQVTVCIDFLMITLSTRGSLINSWDSHTAFDSKRDDGKYRWKSDA